MLDAQHSAPDSICASAERTRVPVQHVFARKIRLHLSGQNAAPSPKRKWHYQTKQTVGASLEFFNKLPKEPAIEFVLIRSRNARSACSRLRDYADISTSVTAWPVFLAQPP
ncbi:MAG: hypothetical protein DMG37_23315 [Acidobacteria bacterium]|nr:MAG: hypothetical protein DMG37_23315 [Acidobacteriota bacterium]